MSDVPGYVSFHADDLTLYFEYHGTMADAWDPPHSYPGMSHDTCTCGRDEPVSLMASYAGGIRWEGTACRYCRRLTEHSRTPYKEDD